MRYGRRLCPIGETFDMPTWLLGWSRSEKAGASSWLMAGVEDQRYLAILQVTDCQTNEIDPKGSVHCAGKNSNLALLSWAGVLLMGKTLVVLTVVLISLTNDVRMTRYHVEEIIFRVPGTLLTGEAYTMPIGIFRCW